MAGHIDDVFESVPVTLIYATGGYVNGIWQEAAPGSETYKANVQQLDDKELANLMLAGQRILDSRKIYINSGDLALLNLGKDMSLLGEEWKITERDVREWRNYAKLIVVRYDDQ
ncbi:hypothetical protein [uncultured Methylophaga sp.]|uniref:hypothetical protein n=1 Tax=uncultured Methylophaga sp. TaxID=285271 RepID=UPI0030F4C566